MMTKRSDDDNPLMPVLEQQAAVIQTMQAKLASLESDVTALKSNSAKAVAFSVRFSSEVIDDVGVGATVKFDRVMYNLGNGYNNQTGLFTAPTSGLYVFYLSLMGSWTQGALDLGITRSGTVLDVAWAEGKGDSYDQGSCLVTSHVTAGENVWVKHVAGSTALVGGARTTFSGFLVRPDL